ncbi:MAG: hypothetical protein ACRYGF_14720 [Janthinobacterium lividum]
MAALARLHCDLGWPKNLLVSQPGNWALDLAALRVDGKTMIAGEVKKTHKETEDLIKHISSLIQRAIPGTWSFMIAR